MLFMCAHIDHFYVYVIMLILIKCPLLYIKIRVFMYVYFYNLCNYAVIYIPNYFKLCTHKTNHLEKTCTCFIIWQ